MAQTTGGDAVGPYSFNCIRSLIGSLVLLPVIAVSDRMHPDKKPKTPEERKALLLGGIACGLCAGVCRSDPGTDPGKNRVPAE